MDWGFLDIFKKAEFNSLMVALAITGWIMYYFQIYNLIFGLACFASIYCVIRFFVFCYLRIMGNRNYKKACKLEQLANEQKEKKYEDNRKIEISRMFDGLSDSNKDLLASIILNGKQDNYNYNVFLLQKNSSESFFIDIAQSITEIFKYWNGSGQFCITVSDYANSIAVTIDPYLYELLKQYIEKTKK